MLRLLTGEPVEDRRDSHLPPEIKALLPEILVKIRSDQIKPHGDGVLVDMSRVVGERICVSTSEDDEIVFAQRPGRKGLTRFVKDRRAIPCRTVRMILGATGRGGFFIVTGFVGEQSAPEPWDRRATARSIPFWNQHALVWGSTPTVLGTETTVCPWPQAAVEDRTEVQ